MQIARRIPFPANSLSSKRALNEISNHLRGSNVQRCGRSFAASVPSDKPIRKIGKRLPIGKRKDMVESFVNNYRAMNSGKFPTASIAQKEVGGSYYLIRKILQELEFNSKMSPINTTSSLGKELAKKNEASTESEDVISSQITIESSSGTEEVSSSQMTMDPRLDQDACLVPVTGLDNYDSNKHLELEGSRTSTSVENVNSEEFTETTGRGDDTDYCASETHLLEGKESEVLPPCPKKPEHNMKYETRSEDVLDFDGPKVKAEQHEHSTIEKLTRYSSEEQTGGEVKKKSSMWGNLKSLANGFFNIWKKL